MLTPIRDCRGKLGIVTFVFSSEREERYNNARRDFADYLSRDWQQTKHVLRGLRLVAYWLVLQRVSRSGACLELLWIRLQPCIDADFACLLPVIRRSGLTPGLADLLLADLVPGVGLEPTRSCSLQRILSPLRLPIPPSRQVSRHIRSRSRVRSHELAFQWKTCVLPV